MKKETYEKPKETYEKPTIKSEKIAMGSFGKYGDVPNSPVVGNQVGQMQLCCS